MAPIYTATKRFDPGCGDAWQEFIAWSNLTHLREVVSLDILLCPPLFQDLIAEDWEYNVQDDFLIGFFHDLDYVVRKAAGVDRANVLALLRNPSGDEMGAFNDSRFLFRGFDLVELQTGISALVNCGGFEKAFAGTELSECGLLPDHDQAVRIQKLLREAYPDEAHADCDSWAIWQMNEHP